MGTHNICFYKEVGKRYTGCNLKTMELLDCVLIGVFAVIRLDTVIYFQVFCYYDWCFTGKKINKNKNLKKNKMNVICS